MTTIAWDGKCLATDSQSTCGEHKSTAKKLFKDIGPFQAVALSGEVRSFDVVLDALRSQATDCEHVDVQGVMVDGKGKAWEFEGRHWGLKPIRPKTAIGSGWAIATAAMEAGADAVDALRITVKLDLYSGGRIHKHFVL